MGTWWAGALGSTPKPQSSMHRCVRRSVSRPEGFRCFGLCFEPHICETNVSAATASRRSSSGWPLLISASVLWNEARLGSTFPAVRPALSRIVRRQCRALRFLGSGLVSLFPCGNLVEAVGLAAVGLGAIRKHGEHPMAGGRFPQEIKNTRNTLG